MSCHSPLKLNNLVRLDLEDRGEWTHRFSTRPSATLGAIIKEVMMEREAVWVSSSGPASSAPAPEPANPPSAAARQASLDQRANAPPLPKVIDQLRDGTPLCPDFQKGRCSQRGRHCPKGQHRCGHLLKGGRVCGSYQHAGHKCTAKNRE